MNAQPPLLKNVFAQMVLETRNKAAVEPCTQKVDVRFYTDPDWFQREQDKLFKRQPLLLGHTSMLRQAGDYFVHDHSGQPILVVRGEDGAIRAFLNVCRHRGVRLVNGEGVQNGPSFVCPYHNWIYGLDGSLRKAPLEETAFGQLDKSCYGLKPLPLNICQGLIFVLPTPGVDLDAAQPMGELAQDLAAFGTADHVFFRESVSTCRSNWKLIIEAFLDGYHVVRLHRKSVGPMFLDAVARSERRGHNIISTVARQEFLQAIELPEDQWNLRTHASCAFYIFPNTTLIIHPDYISYLTIYPRTADETVVVHGCLIAEEPRDEKAAAHWERAYDIIENGVFQAEDLFVCEQAQIGLKSGANEHFLMGTYETSIIDFHQILAEKMGAYPSIG